VARAHRTGRPLSLLLVELRAAEAASEAVPADTELALQEFAALVKRTARAADIPCRRRPNELAIVLPETKDDGARRFYARLRQETSSSFGPDGRTTYSVGLVEWHPDETSGALDTRAALALRRSAGNGSEDADDAAVATAIELGRARRNEPSGHKTAPPMDPRGALLEHLAREIDEARRNGAPLTVAALEIDALRAIEQRVGRAGADALRAHVTARIDDCADEGCVVSRLAADRYAIVFPGATAEHAQDVLAVLQASLELGLPDQEIRILLSAGIGELSDLDDPPSLLRRAEQALRRARTEGGGSVVVATST
jgi:diguanylate cyclase (GGDEF)-like protein